jgi:ribosomal protein L40E
MTNDTEVCDGCGATVPLLTLMVADAELLCRACYAARGKPTATTDKGGGTRARVAGERRGPHGARDGRGARAT